MSAPSIPNLNTLRRGALRGRGGRGRGDTVDAASFSSSRRLANHDETIQKTDQDAASSRLSAVDAGYLDDPFAKYLSPDEGAPKRLPLMNRGKKILSPCLHQLTLAGSYARTAGMDQIVSLFTDSVVKTSPTSKRIQILSLGAGSDTRFFRLLQRRPRLDIVYHEVDFAVNTGSKIARLRSPPAATFFKQQCNVDTQSGDFKVSNDGSELQSPNYYIHARDLRGLSKSKVPLPSLDTRLPTLLISECCLIYLSPNEADAVLDYFSDLFPPDVPLAIVIYEPIRPNDAFGQTMISNLTARGIQLQTLEKYAGLSEQLQRLQRYAFRKEAESSFSSGCGVADIDFVWRRWISQGEKERVEALEWMDEVEEFVLLAQHYCIAWGWRSFPTAPDGARTFERWLSQGP